MSRTKSVKEHGLQSAILCTDISAPKVGTKLRAAYDFLQNNKGRRIPAKSIAAYMRRDLQDYYGCEIEYVGWNNCDMIFVGEHHGDKFVKF